MQKMQDQIKKMLVQFGITAALVVAGIGLLSLVGFPSQGSMDLGKLLGFRFVDKGMNTAAQTGENTGGLGQTSEPSIGNVTKFPQPEDTLDVSLPPAIYSVTDVPVEIYYDNLVLSRDSEQFRFNPICQACSSIKPFGRRSWKVTNEEPGKFKLDVGVSSFDFQEQKDQASTTINTADLDRLKNTTPTILAFGDSITRQHWWVNELARRLNDAGVQNWQMIGKEFEDGTPPFSEKPIAGVKHEAEYGWSFSFFSSFIAADEAQAKTYRREKSPFVYGDSPLEAKLDVQRYYDEMSSGNAADFVIMQAGINDMWGVNPDDAVQLEQRLKLTLDNAQKLVDAFLAANPTTQVGIVLPAPFTRNERDFVDAYGSDVTRWNARRVQHALVKAMIERFKGREAQNVWLVPVYASFDTIDGYPIDNAGHPNPLGQSQIADAVFAWMNWVAASQ